MKQLFMIAACLLTGLAQTSARTAPAQGTLFYDMRIALRKQAARSNAVVARMLPEEQHIEVKLVYRGSNYVLTQQAAVSDRRSPVGGVMATMVATASADRDLVDTRTGRIRSEYLIRNKYYYTDAAIPSAGRITYLKDTRNILGYTCHKAVINSKEGNVTAWYTTEFPATCLPDASALGGIRGTVLEFSSDFITVRAVRFAPDCPPAALTPKSQARKITEEQLQDLREEQMEDLQQNSSRAMPGGTQIQTKTIIIK